ncbi:hypothetical protein BCON_0039g00340 [Botryotinia convoluta]|uniref:Uncharacterized protein n=1 Tax=Botryotinia convoluta TaxID=54673 RepID=A0A4Z1IT93_9HELO|nr:hypothetical protein BCON_0039g00340 [Botryotinia convoluta]
MSTSTRNMVGLPEINMGIRDLKACMEENPLLWQQPAYRWAIEAMLWRFNGLLTDRIDLEIFQDKELFETFFVCSKTITSAIESLGLVAIDAIDESNREPETQSKVVANAEDSSISQASNPAGLGVYQKEDSSLDDTLGITGSRSSIDRSEDSDHVITRHSDNQLSLCPTTSSDESPLNADRSSIVDDESHRGEDTTCTKTISTAEHDEPCKIKKKKKKKSKKKKTTVGDSTEEAILMTVETSHSPTLVLPMAEDYVSPASSMPDRFMAPSNSGINCSDQAVATTMFSETEQIALLEEPNRTVLKFKLDKAPEELRAKPMKDFRHQMIKDLRCIKKLEESRQQSIEDLKAEHQKALAVLIKKHEAIKFENKNLKADRNKELEKLRKENSILRGMSSSLDQEVTQLRAELQLLKSKAVKEESRSPPDVVVGHAEELDYIISHQCHIVAYEMDPETWDEVNRIEEEDDDEKSSTRLKFEFKTLQGESSWDITTYPYMSKGAKKLCKAMKKIRVSNAILRTRCQWYWNQLHEAAQAKRKTLASLLAMENSAILFEAETFDLKERIRELEKSLNIKKISPGVRAIDREKEGMQEKFGVLELTTRELRNEVYDLKRDISISKLIKTNKALIESSATGELPQTARLEEALCEEQSKTKRFSSQIQELQAKVKTLEEERATVDPLIETGVAVRKRFFEQAKSIVSWDERYSSAGHKIIKEGNDRCHRAYCLTDAALFKLLYLSGSANEALYNEIYRVNSHADVTSLPLKLCQALDSNASIKTVRVINNSTTSQELRTEAEQLFSSITSSWNAIPLKNIFEANEKVTGWLSQLHDLEEQIIRIDRSIEYRGYVEDTKDEEETSHSRGWDWDAGEPGDLPGTGDWGRSAEEPGDMAGTDDWETTDKLVQTSYFTE